MLIGGVIRMCGDSTLNTAIYLYIMLCI
jgi:hypothetical protein